MFIYFGTTALIILRPRNARNANQAEVGAGGGGGGDGRTGMVVAITVHELV